MFFLYRYLIVENIYKVLEKKTIIYILHNSFLLFLYIPIKVFLRTIINKISVILSHVCFVDNLVNMGNNVSGNINHLLLITTFFT